MRSDEISDMNALQTHATCLEILDNISWYGYSQRLIVWKVEHFGTYCFILLKKVHASKITL